MRQPAIIRQTRWNPVGLVVTIAVVVLPFALNGGTKGLVIAVVVWVVLALLLVLWWRGRKDPRPPSHSV
jgi:hypothetical protein